MIFNSRLLTILSTITAVAAQSNRRDSILEEQGTSRRGRRSLRSKSSTSKHGKAGKGSAMDMYMEMEIVTEPLMGPELNDRENPDVMVRMDPRSLNDLAFNKVPGVTDQEIIPEEARFVPGMAEMEDMFPLMSDDYGPLNRDTALYLKRFTMADSVVTEDDFQLYGSTTPAGYWLDDDRIKDNLVFPNATDDSFWIEMRKVTEVQIARRNGEDPNDFNTWPEIWSNRTTLTHMAEAVQGEYPCLHQQTIIEKLYKEGGLKMYRDLGPFRSANDFIGKQVRLATINTWTFEAVAPVNFMLKWFIGMPRPEEVAWLIYNDAIADMAERVPADLVAMIKSMDLMTPFEFTAYPPGSPMHPAFPAMHSAGSTVSYWLPVVAKVDAEQYCELLRVDYATAYARTVAGVHYEMDNLAGLNIGQRIIQEKLPEFLKEMYGYDRDKVEKKLEKLSFDWNTFDSKACTIGNMSAGEFLDRAGRF